jgi:hypothetical protein
MRANARADCVPNLDQHPERERKRLINQGYIDCDGAFREMAGIRLGANVGFHPTLHRELFAAYQHMLFGLLRSHAEAVSPNGSEGKDNVCGKGKEKATATMIKPALTLSARAV